ncbi:uncharacterized protein LOC105429645 isoform X1 [Pogonomyrmex barbatus]|uniref:Uncharacterized protein LOC105429645 isoform X1 n=1 Tax=Pogonomyrmex barbatus TaxID=144034 RepID=A0A6I9X8X4_9HYME|nr:uncharacterized protein LOC105429645 isoform X1 [Pogonomyrmex barbatus]
MESGETRMALRIRENVPGSRVGCVRAWGLRGGAASRLSTKLSVLHVRTLARHPSILQPREIDSRFRKRDPCVRRFQVISTRIWSDRWPFRAVVVDERKQNAPQRTQKRELKFEDELSRHRVSRTLAHPISHGGVPWKFYQYRGGHLVLLAVVREKLRAERRTIDRRCRRASRLTNRRGLPEQKEPEAIDYEQH